MQRQMTGRLLAATRCLPGPAVRPLAVRQWAVARTYASDSLPASHDKLLTSALADADPAVAEIVKKEKLRQREFINLIPSENFTSQAVLDTLGSPMQSMSRYGNGHSEGGELTGIDKYSEGYPGARYYGGNEFIDQAERLCQQRALETFRLNPEEWGVNVQPLSGSPANLYAYSAVMQTHDRLMGLDLPHGGHLSHGYQIPSKHISFISKYFTTMPYHLNPETGIIDYDGLEKTSQVFRPKVIVAGTSAYSRTIDYNRMRKIANQCGAYLLSDMAHISGLVAAGVVESPFHTSDIVTTTTHKSLRGPRGAMIFFRKGVRSTDKKGNETLYDLENPINASVFPGHQGGPHNHTITALAVALKQAQSKEFKEYQEQVLKNAKSLGGKLRDMGYKIVGGDIENHLVLIDLKPKGIDGAKVERVLELCNVAANKNTVPGDKSAMKPGGLRLGSPAMTTRGFDESDFERVAAVVDSAVTIAKEIESSTGKAKIKEFTAELGDGAKFESLVKLREDVRSWVRDFPVPWTH